jgi:hypothetical protein
MLEVILILTLSAVIEVVWAAICAIPVMLCWDVGLHGLFPSIIPEISLLRAFAIVVLWRLILQPTVGSKSST